MDKNTVQVLASIATPCIALIALLYARMQAHTNEIKRKQELFNLRYAFYQRIRTLYVDIAHSQEPVNDLILYDLAEEASFLFGDDVAKHIVSISDRKIDSQVEYGIVDDWFINPFKKYLQLK